MNATATIISSNDCTIIPFPCYSERSERRSERRSARPHEAVEPIKDLEDIKAAKEYFLTQETRWQANPTNLRNYMMFVVNINNALRISDLLTLKVGEVVIDSKRSELAGTLTVDDIRDELFIAESKTGKTRYVFFGEGSKEAIVMYLNALPSWHADDYLFSSRQKKDGQNKPISRQMAWNIVNKMGKAISEGRDKQLHLGTHSMRKTFGYQRVKANEDDPMIIAEVSDMYNHSSIKTTYRYLGLDTESKRELCVANEL